MLDGSGGYLSKPKGPVMNCDFDMILTFTKNFTLYDYIFDCPQVPYRKIIKFPKSKKWARRRRKSIMKRNGLR